MAAEEIPEYTQKEMEANKVYVSLEGFEYALNKKEKIIGLITETSDQYSFILRPGSELHEGLGRCMKNGNSKS